MKNRLVYTTPSISTLFNGVPISSFDSFAQIDMFLKVQPASSGIVEECAGNPNKCRVRYSQSYTPVI